MGAYGAFDGLQGWRDLGLSYCGLEGFMVFRGWRVLGLSGPFEVLGLEGFWVFIGLAEFGAVGQ